MKTNQIKHKNERSTSVERQSPSRRRVIVYIVSSFLLGTVLTFLILASAGIYALKTFSRMEELLHGNPWNLPTRVYGHPFEIVVGSTIHRQGVIARLAQLGYYPVSSIQSAGEYSWDEKGLNLYLHDTPMMDGMRKGFPVRIETKEEMVIGIVNTESGKHLSSVMLDPDLLGSIYDPSTEDRQPISLEEVPQEFIDCLLVSEDQSYFEHHGIDPFGILRAIWVNLQEQRYAQGASTITQQLVRSLFLTRKRTMRRKMEEAVMAVLLEMTRSKEKILELYINECYYGQAGAVNIGGLRQGARYYFGTEPRHLTLAQSAMLVAILRGPNYYNPFKYPDRVKKRRDYILARLAQEGKITEEQKHQAINTPLPEVPHSLSGSAPYVVDAVRRTIPDIIEMNELQTEGYTIFTTIDSHMQTVAQETVQKSLKKLEEQFPHLATSSEPLQAALISLDPYTGAVRAMVGGRNFKTSQYNRVLLAQRPIGSVIKPFLALCALEGTHRGDYDWRPNSLLEDKPITIKTPAGPWTPTNFSKEFHGQVPLRRAIENSINIPCIRLSQKIGISVFADFLESLGIEDPPRVPSLVLGTVELSPYKVAGLFTTFPNRGEQVSPFFLRAILKTDNEQFPLSPPTMKRVASQLATYQVLSMLEGVFKRGTAASAPRLGWKGIAAGKTGTTDERKDSWFVGMTPDLLTVVWVGFDDPKSTGLTGSMGALPLWVEFMTQLYPDGNTEPFPVPNGLSQHLVSYSTGSRTYQEGPNVIQEYFLKNSITEQETPLTKQTITPRKSETSEFTTKALPDIHISESEISTGNKE